MPRLPRFARASQVVKIHLTHRDFEVLRHVHQHRFLRSDHLASLLPGSRQGLLRRLQLLFHHDFLDRPRCQIDYYHRQGSRPIAYGLGNKGAAVLKRRLALPFHRLHWPRKGGVERFFLDHALMVSDFMVRLEIACRDRADVRLLTEDDLPPAPALKRRPIQWRVSLGSGVDCGVIPDRVFGLQRADGRSVWFLLEADRGTMPVTRSDLSQSSVWRKFLAYEATWSQQLHRTRFGWSRFRVLTITNNAERLASMRAAARSLKRGHGLFLFADALMLRTHSDILDCAWETSTPAELAMLTD